jgi:flagellar basal-body rod protein FlgB
VLDDIASLTLQTAIHGLSTRQQVSADNIANLETAGFTASSVDFESSLAQAVSAGRPTDAQFTVAPSADPAGVNGNNVNLDGELVTTTKTQLQQQLLTNGLTDKYALISTVLKG